MWERGPWVGILLFSLQSRSPGQRLIWGHKAALFPILVFWGSEVPGSQMGRGLTTMRQSLFSLSCIALVVKELRF